jgi:hypothetical protein
MATAKSQHMSDIMTVKATVSAWSLSPGACVRFFIPCTAHHEHLFDFIGAPQFGHLQASSIIFLHILAPRSVFLARVFCDVPLTAYVAVVLVDSATELCGLHDHSLRIAPG